MSAADIERFVSDLQENASLLDEAKAVSGGVAAMADFAKSKGYDVTADEAKAYISEKANQELTDDQIDSVAGGKGGAGEAASSSVTNAVVEFSSTFISGSANTTTNASLVLAVMGSAATSVVAT
ncbi:MAG: Nif11-like leader peptide family natural product precursor [Rhodospirillaceae bacterium]|jgi:predicted ribosomally synthesized peptide with nif11-like leader|nr:Nif11-like leader peptide family natural product precursor [Rhodospirillaceae bacterium]MBT5659174.1 Nif11-like leader peptide family natural product precursor [Rhodospirillaceae bacterium]MBT5751383.1 Nif11-like leader peptide family natural product precursor [Rhodospirillaceae bacterium]